MKELEAQASSCITPLSCTVLLVSGKCNVNIRDSNSNSTILLKVLQMKKSKDLLASIKVLVPFCPNLNHVDSAGNDVLRIATERHYRNDIAMSLITCMPNSPPVSEQALDRLYKKKTALIKFFDAKSYRTARGMLLLGADPSILPKKRKSPLLHDAIRKRQLALVQLILERAPNFTGDLRHELDKHGFHPTLIAVQDKDPYFVRSVMQAYIDFNENLSYVYFLNPKYKKIAKTQRNVFHFWPGTSLLLETIKRGFTEAFMILVRSFEVSTPA